jgi:glutathione S-transferase
MNYVEWIASCLAFLLIGGLYFPIPSASISLAIIIARFIYAYGYTTNGPAGSLIGALGNDVLVLAQLILAIISSVYFIQAKPFVP